MAASAPQVAHGSEGSTAKQACYKPNEFLAGPAQEEETGYRSSRGSESTPETVFPKELADGLRTKRDAFALELRVRDKEIATLGQLFEACVHGTGVAVETEVV